MSNRASNPHQARTKKRALKHDIARRQKEIMRQGLGKYATSQMINARAAEHKAMVNEYKETKREQQRTETT